MPTSRFRKPLLPSHYCVWYEPPDESGDEILRVVSGRRALKLKGRAFREFQQRVMPLLDGEHTVDEIARDTADVFAPQDLIDCLNTLGEQGILVEGAPPGGVEPPPRLKSQINFFHDLTPDAWEAQSRLRTATVAVIGLGGAGAATALALASAGVGKLRCIDPYAVTASDVYYSPFLAASDVGAKRAAAVARSIEAAAPEGEVAAICAPVDAEESVRDAIADSGYAVCCLDTSQLNLALKVNRVCLAAGVPWIACSLGGAEVTIGPAVIPGHGPCYMCYRMRSVACAGNPEEAFAFERWLDRRKRDESGRRENLVFSVGMAANFLGLEAVKTIAGLAEPSLAGRILTIQLTDLAIERHTVLRKPWCPACFGENGAVHAG